MTSPEALPDGSHDAPAHPRSIRPAEPADVPAILSLIRELADYERSLSEVQATEQSLRESLFAAQPAVFAHVVEHEGTVAGFALWFLNFSTWLSRHGIYLEDLYVRPDLRGRGYGRALLAELASIAVQRGYGRLEWAVLDWNEPAIGFYRSLGAVSMDEWTANRVTGEPLTALAAEAVANHGSNQPRKGWQPAAPAPTRGQCRPREVA
jgi:GNAT superfamily N-acetyltransferase